MSENRKIKMLFRIANFNQIRENDKAQPVQSELMGVSFRTNILFKQDMQRALLYMAIEVAVCDEPEYFDPDWIIPICVSIALQKNGVSTLLLKEGFFFEHKHELRRYESLCEPSLLLQNLRKFLSNGQLQVTVELTCDVPIGLLNHFSTDSMVIVDGYATQVNKNLLIANSRKFKSFYEETGQELEFSRQYFFQPQMSKQFRRKMDGMDLDEAFRVCYRMLSKADYFAHFTDENVVTILIVAKRFELLMVERIAIYYIVKSTDIGFVRKRYIFENLGYEQWKNFVVLNASPGEITLHPEVLVANMRAARKLTSKELQEALQQALPEANNKKEKD